MLRVAAGEDVLGLPDDARRVEDAHARGHSLHDPDEAHAEDEHGEQDLDERQALAARIPAGGGRTDGRSLHAGSV